MSDDIPEVNAKRRLKGSQPTGQASRPVRRQTPPRPSSSGSGGIGMTPPPSSGSSGTGYGGGIPSSGGSSFGSGGLGSLLGSLGSGTSGKRGGCGSIVGIIIVLLVIFFVFRMCSGGSSLLPQLDQNQPSVPQPSQDDTFVPQQPTNDDTVIQPYAPIATPWPTALPSNNSGKTWLVMLYQNADDNALEHDIMIDLNEAEMIGSTDQVMIVSQLDRFRGGYSGDGDWSSTRRYLVTYDNDLNRIGSDLIADIGEVNMGEAATLVDFVSWAASTYPADNHVLIMSDHGMG